jgi:asparagine synthase (glutamine-hydrolysing)
MYAFRDPNGMKPLYYARGRKLVAFASERKALWRIGLTQVNRILPGYVYSSKGKGITIQQVVRIRRPSESPMTILTAKRELKRLLSAATRKITKGIDRVAVAFSGGLDSALTATLAKACTEVNLVSVGLRGSPELLNVEKFALELHLPLTIHAFEADSLEEYVRRIVWLIEEPSLMKVSVAIPLHWAAMQASKLGFRIMLCGQGSDELYGGYYKYAHTLDTKGRKMLGNELYRSVIEASQVNYERDEQATAPLGIELRTPFSDLDVMHFSLTIPSEYKVKSGNDQTRKWILRSLANDVGVPEDMAWRRKKAIQHGTGVENAIRKLAKRSGLTGQSYLAKIHEEVRDLDSMP